MSTTVTKREPTPQTWFRRTPVKNLRHEMEELLTHFFNDATEGWLVDRMVPSIDLEETQSELEVRMDIPGAKPADFDIQVHGDVLTISGKRIEEKEQKGRTFHVVERARGYFSRSITLPCEVQENKAEATYKDGVLTVRVPKSAECRAHKVPVKET